MKKYGWLNGKIVDITKPLISITDLGVLRGYGVFDFFRIVNGKIFHYDDHFRRFQNSAKLLGLKVPCSQLEVEKIVETLLVKNKVREACIRLVLTGGPSDNGISFDPHRETFAILIEDVYDATPAQYEKGVRLITMEYLREIPAAKSTNYIEAVRLQGEMKKKGATEVLFHHQGRVLETSRGNFMVFKGDTLIAPANDILFGITRKIALKLAKKKFKVEERDLSVDELNEATEAIVLGTNKIILPAVKIDDQLVGDGKVGANSRWLRQAFLDYMANYSK